MDIFYNYLKKYDIVNFLKLLKQFGGKEWQNILLLILQLMVLK